MMQTHITARHFKASQKLQDYATERVSRLLKFYDGITHADIILSQENTVVDPKTVEISVSVYHQKLTAHDVGGNHREAINKCVDSLRRQIIKYKDKLRRN